MQVKMKEGGEKVTVREGNVRREADVRIRGGQGMQAAATRWKRQGHRLSPRISSRKAALPTPGF